MSSISSVGSSSSASYAVSLAQSSKLGRSLGSLDGAVQSGNLTAAGDIIAALVKDYPQYAVSSADGSSSLSDPINQGFQALSTAISNGSVDDARNAWAGLKQSLADSGVTLSDNNSTMQKIIAEARESVDEAIISSLGLGSSDSGRSAALLTGSGSGTSDSLSALVSSWVTYKTNGATTPIAASGATTVASTASTAPTNSTASGSVSESASGGSTGSDALDVSA